MEEMKMFSGNKNKMYTEKIVLAASRKVLSVKYITVMSLTFVEYNVKII